MTGQVCSLDIILEASGRAPNDKKAGMWKKTYIYMYIFTPLFAKVCSSLRQHR